MPERPSASHRIREVRDEIASAVKSAADAVAAIRQAAAPDKGAAYAALGLSLTYHPQNHTLRVRLKLGKPSGETDRSVADLKILNCGGYI
jgi:hypothetical protein